MPRCMGAGDVLRSARFDLTVSSDYIMVADIFPAVPAGRRVDMPPPNVGGAKVFAVWSIGNVNY